VNHDPNEAFNRAEDFMYRVMRSTLGIKVPKSVTRKK
jgi:hypothetical protein